VERLKYAGLIDAGAVGTGSMIIDAHQHFWDLSRADYSADPDAGVLYRNYFAARSSRDAARQRRECNCVGSAAATEDETHYLLQLAEAHPFVAGVVGWVDFERPMHPNALQRWQPQAAGS